MPRQVFLFDVDSVLVNPLGYRAALQATVNYFSQMMRWGDQAPDIDTIEHFEAIGISSEWDSAAICLAILLREARKAFPRLPETLSDALKIIVQRRVTLSAPPNYKLLSTWIMEDHRAGEIPSETALRRFSGDKWPAADPLLSSVLLTTRDVNQSATTRIFQHYTLGSDHFEQTYGFPAHFKTESLLASMDQPLLYADVAKRVMHGTAEQHMYAAVYTARPSFPPLDVETGHQGYAPEAEIALDIVGLSRLPLIAEGKLRWLGEQLNVTGEHFLKPNPVQALAAVMAALAVPQSVAVLSAEEMVRTNKLAPQLEPFVGHPIDILVFEDSASGILGGQAAGELLNKYGIPTRVFGYGISPLAVKQEKLAATGATLFDDINLALSTLEF